MHQMVKAWGGEVTSNPIACGLVYLFHRMSGQAGFYVTDDFGGQVEVEAADVRYSLYEGNA